MVVGGATAVVIGGATAVVVGASGVVFSVVSTSPAGGASDCATIGWDG